MRLKLVAVALAALAPVIAILAYNEVATRRERTAEVTAQAAQAARQASSEVERIVEGVRSMMVAVTSMPAVRRLDGPTCNEALKSLAENVANVGTIFVLRDDGVPVCGSVEIPAKAAFGDREYFRKALDTRAFVVGKYTKSRMTGAAVLPMAMPLIEGDVVTAVVVSGIRLDWLQTRITERGVAPGNAVTLADSDGTIIARVPLPERFVGTVIPGEYQRLIHADRPGVIEVRSQDGTERLLGYRPISEPGSPIYVSAGFSVAEAFAPINRTTIANALGIAAGAVASLILAVFIGDRFLLAPISRIADVMERWKSGEGEARTQMKAIDELHAVGATLDSLLDELDCRRLQNEAAAEERTLLVRELAHRVKNGFALVQAIARQTFGRADPDRYRSFSERLAALAGTYDLLLSKEGAASSMKEVVAAALHAHLSEAGRISVSGPDVPLPPDLALPLSLVLHELATNATKYGSLHVEEGTIAIDWTEIDGRIDLCWREAGGPAVVPPTRKGFGSALIERAFPSKANPASRAEFRPAGLVFEIGFDMGEKKQAGRGGSARAGESREA
jgi:two-component sensor histidine kinase